MGGVRNSRTGVIETAFFAAWSIRIFPVKVERPRTHVIQMPVDVMFA